MKKVLIVLLTLLMTLAISGCDKGMESIESVDISRPSEMIPEIMMIKVHQNYAWGRHQSITVIDRDGKRRSQSVGRNDGEKPEGWVELSEDGWYDALLEIARSGEREGSLAENKVDVILRKAQYFSEWSGLPVKEYETQMFDYGAVTLYGIYYDADGNPQKLMLASAGDVPYCLDSKEVMRFVNKIALLDFEFT